MRKSFLSLCTLVLVAMLAMAHVELDSLCYRLLDVAARGNVNDLNELLLVAPHLNITLPPTLPLNLLFFPSFFIKVPGVNVNEHNSFGESALHLAAVSSKLEIVRLLLSSGANASAVTNGIYDGELYDL